MRPPVKKRLLLPISALLLVLVAMGLVVSSGGGREAPKTDLEASLRGRGEPPSVLSPPARQLRQNGARSFIRGTVSANGRGIPEATIVAKSEFETREATSASDGRFELALPPGGWLLSARTYTLASGVHGPFLLGEGQQVDGVLLELLGAAQVSGRVVDAITGEAIVAARIRSSAGEVSSDHAGRFELGPLPATETWIEASSPKHLARLEWLTLDGAGDRSGLELYLRPAALVAGRVLRQGAPVPGAIIGATIVRGVGGTDSVITPVRADDEGRFVLSLSGGVVQLWASEEDGARVKGPEIRLAEGESREDVSIELGEGLTARGDVLSDGGPLAGAFVTLLDAEDFSVIGSARTDGAGRFQIRGVAPGSFLVQLDVGSLSGQRGPFTLTGPDDAPWRLEFDPTRMLSGRVEPAMAGVLVRWRSSDWAGDAAAQTSTVADGSFHFTGVPEGLLTIEAEGQGGAASTRAKAGEVVVLRLARSALRGSVQDERGRSVTDFTVRLEPVEGGETRTLSVVSASGDFVAHVPSGAYRVHVRASGQGTAASVPTVEVPATGEASVVITLRQGRRVHGHVLENATGKPLANVEVGFYSSRGRSRDALAVVRTDAEGYFEVASVPGHAWVRLRAPGHRQEWIHPRRLPREESAPVKWLLGPGKDTHGDVPPYEGIGAVLSVKDGYAAIQSTFERSPAQAAGLVRGDVILEIDGEAASASDVRMLQGITQRIMGPAGSVVRLTIRRGEQTQVVPLRRRKIAP